MVNGFFILMENQYAVGDSVTIGAFTGSVEEVSLRRTVLRSVRGEMIVIPNGTITAVHGPHMFADARTQGLGEQPCPLYTVAFSGQELWGGEPGAARLTVSIDAWEPYLEPV